MNAATRLTGLRLSLPPDTTPFSRADLVFFGLEHGGPSVEVRIFFNAPDADESTPTTDEAGFVGLFSIFGHGGCFGDEGQLQVFDVWESQEAFDEFLTYLGPVMQELGIELAQPPSIMPVVDLVQQ